MELVKNKLAIVELIEWTRMELGEQKPYTEYSKRGESRFVPMSYSSLDKLIMKGESSMNISNRIAKNPTTQVRANIVSNLCEFYGVQETDLSILFADTSKSSRSITLNGVKDQILQKCKDNIVTKKPDLLLLILQYKETSSKKGKKR